MNRVLREQLEMLTANRSAAGVGVAGGGGAGGAGGAGAPGGPVDQATLEAIKREMSKREVLIAQLITQSEQSFALPILRNLYPIPLLFQHRFYSGQLFQVLAIFSRWLGSVALLESSRILKVVS